MVGLMGNKLILIISLILGLVGCGSDDYSKSLAGGYTYHDWGRRFITLKIHQNKEESLVIDSEVTDYQLKNNWLIVTQVPNQIELGNEKPIYWLIDINTKKTQQFLEKADFTQALRYEGLLL